MDRTNTATAADGRDENDNLAGLVGVVTEAVAFAEKWPETYRVRAFDLALEKLISARPPVANPTVAASAPVTPIVTGGISAVAREISVEPRLLTRIVEIGEEGKISLLGRVDGRKNSELQVKYSTVYCYLKEKALGQLNTPIDELRALCQDRGCYDGDNFTSYFRNSDLFRELGEKGARDRTYRLSNKGLEEAKVLLKAMAEQ
jgi:hypothetical protein